LMLHYIYSRSFINVITFMVLALAAWGAMPAFVGARCWRGGPRADAPDDRLIVGQFCNGLHQFLFIFRVHIGCLLIQNDDGRVLHDGPRNGYGERLRFEWNMAERRRDGDHGIRPAAFSAPAGSLLTPAWRRSRDLPLARQGEKYLCPWPMPREWR